MRQSNATAKLDFLVAKVETTIVLPQDCRTTPTLASVAAKIDVSRTAENL